MGNEGIYYFVVEREFISSNSFFIVYKRKGVIPDGF